ncbi:MAG TPA: DUF2244 domain-containing protein [Burkholderiaceae bacterium]|nr:DUF2244 domain-containing protein [Burkholderiaceae bacterium]
MIYQWQYVVDAGRHQWLIKRNCSLAPRQLGCWFGSLAAFSMLLALVFAARGAWLVVPFALIQVGALAAVFVWWGRHACDYERIVVCAGEFSVETSNGETLRRIEQRPAWARVEYDGARHGPIRIVTAEETIEVGALVPEDRRQALAQELRGAFGSPHAIGSVRLGEERNGWAA